MGDLQASIDFSVELGTFYNLDLFQRGYYQIRIGLKSFTNRTPLKIKCNRPKNKGGAHLRPPGIIQGVAVSQTFQVMYKNEDVVLNDVFSFSVHMLLDSNKMEETIAKAGLKLIVELWFNEEDPDNNEKFEVACTRVFNVNFSSLLGLHVHVPIVFDYFHLCAMCTTVHATLIALHQPIYNPRNPAASWPLRAGQMSTLDGVLFGAKVPVHAFVHIKSTSLRSANYMFRLICRMLLSAHESLQNTYKRFVKRLQSKRITEPDYRDCHAELDRLCDEQEKLKTEEEFLSHATSRIAHLCAYNVVLWQTFTEAFSYNMRITRILAKEYHQTRTKRLSESFFTQEHPKSNVLMCFEPRRYMLASSRRPLASIHGHNDLAQFVRTSTYFTSQPEMSLLCVDLDGDSSNLPIIFEDIYMDDTTPPLRLEPTRPVSSWDVSSLGSEDSGQVPSREHRKSQQMIKNMKPSTLTRPSASKVYSMTEEDHFKREMKEQRTNTDPELVGFKKLNNEVADMDPYEVGCLSPEPGHALQRRKSLLLPNGEKRRRKKNASESQADQTVSDNFSELQNGYTTNNPHNHKSSLSGSSDSSGSNVSMKDINISPKSEKSYRPTSSASKTSSPSPLLRMKGLRGSKGRKSRPQSATGIPRQGHISPPNAQDQRHSTVAVNGVYHMVSSQSEPRLSSSGQVLVQPVADHIISFLTCKEDLKAKLAYHGHLYSDFANMTAEHPYFWPPPVRNKDLHFIICVHGLDGNSQDLRLFRQYLELALPEERFEFLMSEVNVRERHTSRCCCLCGNFEDTFQDIDVMADKLADEIVYHMDLYSLVPAKVSFAAHSLGNIITRQALTNPKLADLIPKLYTYLSLSGPHLGTLYCQSGLVNMGMWVMQKWKKTGSLLQLALKDHADPKESFLYKLSKAPGLEYFKNVLLVSSMQDKYVPYHSTRIEVCRSAVKDSSAFGNCYIEMVNNILQPLIRKHSLTLVRFDVFHTLPTSTNSMIGRAAHIAVLDSELFIEKFLLVCACKYFR